MTALLACMALAGSTPSPASEDTGIELAGSLLEKIDARGAMRAEFDQTIGDLLQRLSESGFPDAATIEVKRALSEWYEQEIVWSEIQPRLAAAYARDFSPEELRELIAFFDTPLGRKAASRLPSLTIESATIRQEYASTKQESLNTRIAQVVGRYQVK
ncbi:MAG: DUF2059 domain-containing protein [Opitutaceae bacterium]|nr:DUF2059 domain-containing protein [Opitutaceae bacterium]